jgi:vitamin B12 transporter
VHGVSALLRPAFPLSVCLSATLASAAAVAESTVEVADAERVFVTATRSPTPLEEILASVLVIDRAAIEASAAGDVPELLRFHAGLELARNGGPGQTTAVFIRGADSNHTLVLVDGVRINPGTIGLAALQNIPPAMIERIEVVKGPRSALYGSDAIGGVINVITRRGARDGWNAEVGVGDYDTRQAGFSGGIATSHLELELGAFWADSAGFPTRSDDRTERGYDNLSASAQLRAAVGRAEVALRHWSAQGTTEYSDFYLTPVDQDYQDSTTALAVSWPVGTDAQVEVGGSRFEDRIEQNQSADYLKTVRYGTSVQADWRATATQSLAAGAMYSSEQASSESYGSAMRADTDTLNLFVQDSLAAGPHRGLVALGYNDHETAGDAWTWNLEYGYSFALGTQLYGLLGSGFRAPDATDRYGFGGNPDLEPERSNNYEAGLRHRLDGRHSVSLAAFRNDIDDLIEFVTLSYDPFYGENRNVDRARIEGIEAAYEYDAAPWRVRLEAIHQDPRNLTTGEELYRRASDSVTLAAQRRFGRVALGLDVLYAGERKDFGWPAPVTLDSYVLANLTASWQVTRALAVSGRIENLLNEQYELADTFNTPDRGLYVSVRYAPGSRGAGVVAAAPARDAGPGRGAYSASMRRSGEGRPWATD